MKITIIPLIVLIFLLVSCGDSTSISPSKEVDLGKKENGKTISLCINKEGKTIFDRFETPEGYTKTKSENGSFGEYLQEISLKPYGEKVQLFDGSEKPIDSYDSVLDIDIGMNDWHQASESIIRLWSEYLYKNEKYSEINFSFESGFNANFGKWAKGYRIKTVGNKATWVKSGVKSNDYNYFRQYLDYVYKNTSTTTLEKELKSVDINDMQIGDIFISQEYCVIVVDMARNPENGGKIFIVAQEYTQAQGIYVVKNIDVPELSPWYSLIFEGDLKMPECVFKKDDLKRFK
jgi:hypothetical protein